MMDTGNQYQLSAGQEDQNVINFIKFNVCYVAFRVCQGITYTHIIHYEDLKKEWPQFLSDINIKERELRLPWRNNKKGNSDDALYYDPVTREEKMKLYQIYKDDFVMFGYDINDVI